MTVPYYDAAQVRQLLDYPGCIAAIRAAMRSLSVNDMEQPLRNIIGLGPQKLFALMPGTMPDQTGFGAKVISAFGDPQRPGRSAHRGVVVLFDQEDGAVRCMADAGEVTHIRTAAASAVATDMLARADARRLAIFGCGAQARTHIRALAEVRPVEDVVVWARDFDAGVRFAAQMAAETGLPVRAVAQAASAAREADIICTVTGASEPVLLGEWLQPGAHVNIVGSSYAGPVEVDHTAVLSGRFFVDSRRSALVAAAEFLRAKEAGLIGDEHIVAEIGEVLAGTVPGRLNASEITLYKSLGHVVQDLAATQYLHERT